MESKLFRSRTLRRGTVLLISIVVLGFAHLPILREVAAFLVIEDPLQPAAAIVVLGGGMPGREIKAARIYKSGWAPVVLLVRGAHLAHSKELQNLGIPIKEAWKVGREVLIRQGIPASAILVVKDDAPNTFEELQAAFRALPSKESPVILVTSKSHTRRARLTWQYVTQGQSRAIMQTVARDSFDTIQWWYEQQNVSVVAHEYLGIVNAYAGFPISGWNDLSRILATLTKFLNHNQPPNLTTGSSSK